MFMRESSSVIHRNAWNPIYTLIFHIETFTQTRVIVYLPALKVLEDFLRIPEEFFKEVLKNS